jgi:hypothetical protein
MNNLITVVGITIVSLLLVSPFFLQTQKAYEKDAYVQGNDKDEDDDDEEIKDSQEATEEEEEAMKEAEEDDDDD